MSLRQFWQKKIRRIFEWEKRERFVAQTLALTVGLLFTQLISEEWRFWLVGFLAVFSYGLTAWSLKEDIKGIEWFLLFILPVLFVTSVSLFYFLLPGRWISRLTVILIFAIGNYAILLLENIYNIAAIRSIQLLRVAQSVGLFFTVLVVFFLSHLLFSLKLPYWLNGLIIFPLIFLLALQALWSINLESFLSFSLFSYSLVVALILGELAFALSFWPVSNTAYSLLLTGGFYLLAGVIQQRLAERLFLNVLRESLIIFGFNLFLLFLVFLTSKWQG